MTTWRERIQAAHERRRGLKGLIFWIRNPFTTADHVDSASAAYCACAEALDHYGLDVSMGALGVDRHGRMLLGAFPNAIYMGRVNEAERLLDLIEDRALQLKRAAGSMHAPATAPAAGDAPR